MSSDDARKDASGTLYGPTVEYADGRIVPGDPIDIERVLAQFERSDANARSAFLCIIAHDLTVAIRSVVFDPPVTDAGLERVRWINESLHHLTSCVNPYKRWSAHDEAMLIRGIIESSSKHGFDKWVGSAIAAAVRHTIETKQAVQVE
jgi:hypothetical protein